MDDEEDYAEAIANLRGIGLTEEEIAEAIERDKRFKAAMKQAGF
jgi:hypothetical protein